MFPHIKQLNTRELSIKLKNLVRTNYTTQRIILKCFCHILLTTPPCLISIHGIYSILKIITTMKLRNYYRIQISKIHLVKIQFQQRISYHILRLINFTNKTTDF
ncbi:MAG: hypothetical protein QG651_927 [Pseudomonadota bacterium]|jgi:hypothetical protein|nr:hypothetical protein [Pseudomonadota bacterium]